MREDVKLVAACQLSEELSRHLRPGSGFRIVATAVSGPGGLRLGPRSLVLGLAFGMAFLRRT